MSDWNAPTKITNAQFAEIAARLAQTAASWAADSLMLPEQRDQPLPRDALTRFLTDMRQRLDWLEERSR